MLCAKLGIDYSPIDPELRIGIADNVFTNLNPVNGLRHPHEGLGTGWFVWSGPKYSEEADFFKPHCVHHLLELKPKILKYLALPPGFRFLMDDKGYEDVWFDGDLLNI